jgi:hypothetical protein
MAKEFTVKVRAKEASWGQTGLVCLALTVSIVWRLVIRGATNYNLERLSFDSYDLVLVTLVFAICSFFARSLQSEISVSVSISALGVQFVGRNMFLPRDEIVDVIVVEHIQAHKVVSFVMFRCGIGNEIRLVEAFPGILTLSYAVCLDFRQQIKHELETATTTVPVATIVGRK